MASLTLCPWVIRNYAIHDSIVLGSTEGGLTFLECNNPKSFYEYNGHWVSGYSESLPDIREARETASEPELDRLMYWRGIELISEHPGGFVSAIFSRIGHLWRPIPRQDVGAYDWRHAVVMFVTWLPAFITSIWVVVKRGLWKQRDHILILLALLWVTISAGLIRSGIRYRAPIEPFIVLYAAAGFYEIYERFIHRGQAA